MINRNLRRKYFEMQGKVIFPENKGCNNKQLAATVSANFASIGFPMTTEQLNNLICSTEEDINEFYSENYTMLKEILGADKIQKPFYPDFPEGCMDKTDADYFIDQIIYGLSGLTLEPIVYLKEKKRFPFIGTPMRRIMLSGSIEDLHNTFILALKSPIAYSKLQRDFMYDYLSEYPEKIEEVIKNSNTKNRENAVTCAIIVEDFLGNTLHTKSFMKQPTDLLRYSAFVGLFNASHIVTGTPVLEYHEGPDGTINPKKKWCDENNNTDTGGSHHERIVGQDNKDGMSYLVPVMVTKSMTIIDPDTKKPTVITWEEQDRDADGELVFETRYKPCPGHRSNSAAVITLHFDSILNLKDWWKKNIYDVDDFDKENMNYSSDNKKDPNYNLKEQVLKPTFQYIKKPDFYKSTPGTCQEGASVTGGINGSAGFSPGTMTETQTEVARAVYSELTTKFGLTSEQAVGVLVNIKRECDFNYTLIENTSSSKKGYGLWMKFENNLKGEDVAVMSQPAGTMNSIMFDDEGNERPTAKAMMCKNLIIADFGFGTFDPYGVINRKKVLEESINNLGMKRVLEVASSYIYNDYHMDIRIPQMRKYMKDGYVKVVDIQNMISKRVPLDNYIERACMQVAEEATKKLYEVASYFNDYEVLIVTGGTGAAWFDFIKEKLSGMDGLDIISGNDGNSLPIYMANVRGYYMSAYRRQGSIK